MESSGTLRLRGLGEPQVRLPRLPDGCSLARGLRSSQALVSMESLLSARSAFSTSLRWLSLPLWLPGICKTQQGGRRLVIVIWEC